MCSRIHRVNYVLWLLTLYLEIRGQEPLAILPQGRIAGTKIYTKSSLVPVEIFLGIPYALAPTGKHRHAPPERHPGWQKTLLGHRMPPRCPQGGDQQVRGYVSEDCLFLNIWTPQTDSDDTGLIPVLVIFYSESWTEGVKSILTCEELAAEGLVVVTVGYRLHMLSYFTLQTKAARGNLGLLDQSLALLWLRDNVAAFGGDAASITLLGHSAGADSVLYHIASSRSLGLFKRAIVMSPRDVWKTVSDKDSTNVLEMTKLSIEYARKLGCISSSAEDLLRCLRSRPLDDILKVYETFNDTSRIGPIQDNFLSEVDQFMRNSIADGLSDTNQPTIQLDLLLGSADLEAIDTNFAEEDYVKIASQGKKRLLEYAREIMIPELLNTLSMQYSNRNLLTEAILWEYWSSKSSEGGGTAAAAARTVENIARAQSSVRWGAAMALLAARLARRLARLYVYRYTQPAGVDLSGNTMNYTGAAHGTDMMSLLGEGMLLQVARRPPTTAEQQASSSLRRYFVNFVKYGTPSTDKEWPRYRVGDAYIHNLRDKNYAHVDHSAARDVAFWLQYLPHLSNLLDAPDQARQLSNDGGDGRLRGGVVALSGLTVALLLLLAGSAALLRWEKMKRAHYDDNDDLSPQTL